MGSSPIRVAISVEVKGIYASVAQLVEQRTENPRVVGSSPTGGTIFADLAHLVERHLAKVEVAGSSPVIRSKAKRPSLRWSLCFGAQLTGFFALNIKFHYRLTTKFYCVILPHGTDYSLFSLHYQIIQHKKD